MIETEQQRRWWFATHPEYSSSYKKERSVRYGGDYEGSDNPSPEFVDAWVDGALEQEGDDFFVELFTDIKSRYGTESTPNSSQPSDHPAADLNSYDQYEDVLDSMDRVVNEDAKKEAAIKSLMEAGWSQEKAEERWKVFKLSDDIARAVADAVAAARARLTGKYSGTTSPGEASIARLPPKGTPEYAKIQAARNLGVCRKKAEELADIQAGGKGSGVWSKKELETIRRTGEFPPGTEWHHEPTVANRPDLASDPKVVHPVRGGRKAHFDLHGRDWRNPRK